MRPFLSALLLCLTTTVTAQMPSQGVKVFIDCNAWCDFQFIKTEINYVDFVPDQFSSNVFVMITSQGTGSGGQEIKLFFSGRDGFRGLEDTLRYNTSSIGTDDENRRLMVKYVKLGLTRYVARTELADKLIIRGETTAGSTPLNGTDNKKDPWKYWVMNLRLSGNYSKDDYSKSFRYNTGFEAAKITEDIKLRTGLFYNKNERIIKIDNTESKYPSKNYSGYANVVKSITRHWSYGGQLNYTYSTFSNYQSSVQLLPALEYSLFPYADAVKKAATVYYQVGPTWNKYIDTSYYGKTKERLVPQVISVNFGFTQKWGNVYADIAWETFLNSFTLENVKIRGTKINTFSLGASAEVRLVKGLFFNTYFGSEFTKGVFPNLRKSDFNPEDILASVRQYPTTNSFYINFGFTYRFGSIYNNVVNPRFNANNFF